MNIINLYFELEESDLLENFVLFIKNKKGTN